jgi:CheY-like chemotaxis protein
LTGPAGALTIQLRGTMNTILVVDDRPDARYALVRTLTGAGLHRRRGLDAGADEYLTEPIEPQLLVDTVKRLLARRGN